MSNEETLKLIKEINPVNRVNHELEDSVKAMQMLQNELATATEVLVPLLKQYVTEIITLRMSFGREVQDILRSARELSTVVKTVPDLQDFATTIIMINNALTDDVLKKLEKLVK